MVLAENNLYILFKKVKIVVFILSFLCFDIVNFLFTLLYFSMCFKIVICEKLKYKTKKQTLLVKRF